MKEDIRLSPVGGDVVHEAPHTDPSVIRERFAELLREVDCVAVAPSVTDPENRKYLQQLAVDVLRDLVSIARHETKLTS